LTLLRADIGLCVGIESGKIYLQCERPVTPSEVKVRSGDRGLTYDTR
jgi:hypothetical protein